MAKVADLAKQIKAKNERLGITPKGKDSKQPPETSYSGIQTPKGNNPPKKGKKSPGKKNGTQQNRKKDKTTPKKRTTLSNVNTSKDPKDHRKDAKEPEKKVEKPKDPPKVKEWWETFGGISKKMAISGGNKKLGQVPYLSLPPAEVCSKDLPCYEHCYAQKQTGMLGSVQSGYKKNLDFYKKAPDDYFKGLSSWIKLKGDITMFRFHTAGDIPDQGYLDGMLKLIREHQDIVFIIFTKQYDLKYPTPAKLPDNLVMIFSMWPDHKVKKKLTGYSKAWIEGDSRIPANSLRMYGTCDYFGLDIRALKWDIVFRMI